MGYHVKVEMTSDSIEDLLRAGEKIETTVGGCGDAGTWMVGKPARDMHWYYSTELEAASVVQQIEDLKLPQITHVSYEMGDFDSGA